ncbi:MAG TPA: hypothetical protein VMB25_11810 [Bryobacteraceae bacterium]|nr:hypothetical protein [Bryobacteraceae bacterium]
MKSFGGLPSLVLSSSSMDRFTATVTNPPSGSTRKSTCMSDVPLKISFSRAWFSRSAVSICLRSVMSTQ